MGLAQRFLSTKGAAFGTGSVRGGVGGQVIVEGLEELMANLTKLTKVRGRQAWTAGAAGVAQQAAKDIKKDIPSRYKQQRKMIGWRRLKVKEAPDGGAKVGGRVGKTSRARSSRTSGKGVGISATNIHWMITGTPKRTTQPTTRGNTRYVGQMWDRTPRPVDPIMRYMLRNKTKYSQIFRAKARKQITKGIMKDVRRNSSGATL